MIEIAHARRRFGYRRIHDMLRAEFSGVNHKRVYRLYSEANLTVRKRKKAKRPATERVPLQLAQSVNQVWSMDFVSDSLANGRRIKFLTVADGPTAAWVGYRRHDLPSCIASALAMQLDPIPQLGSINLETPDFLHSFGTPAGGRS